MAKDERLGDKMPGHRPSKWASMIPGESHLSEEWHDMKAGESPTTDKWDDMERSKGHMSEKWEEMEAGTSPETDKWHEMKQDRRIDPYEMHSSDGDRAEASMKKQSSNAMKNEGHGRYEVRGSEGQSGKGL